MYSSCYKKGKLVYIFVGICLLQPNNNLGAPNGPDGHTVLINSRITNTDISMSPKDPWHNLDKINVG